MIMRMKAETEGKTKDVGLLDVTPENFIVPKGKKVFIIAVLRL